MNKEDLKRKYEVFDVSGGAYGEGFWTCMKLMDSKYTELEELLKHIKSELKRNPDILPHLVIDINRKIDDVEHARVDGKINIKAGNINDEKTDGKIFIEAGDADHAVRETGSKNGE